jgi:hypothetical protein
MGFNMNNMKMVQMIMKSKNPEQFVMNMLQEKINATNNPMLINMLNLAKQGKTNDIEEIARNVFKEQGLDFDKEFNSFRNSLKL